MAIEPIAPIELQGGGVGEDFSRVVKPSEVMRMEDAMRDGQPYSQDANNNQPVDTDTFCYGCTAPPVARPETNLGDKVLDGIGRVKELHDKEVKEISEFEGVLKKTDIQPAELLGMQMNLLKISLHGELIAKTASKSTQNLDTLLKTQ